jgi:oligopeptide transport system substrate-binding protein
LGASDTDPAGAFQRYQRGETDILILPSILIGEMKASYRSFPEQYLSIPELATLYFGFNVRQPPFDDRGVRRAFALALDKDVIADEILDGLDFPARGGIVPPGVARHCADIGAAFSPDEARRLNREAGYTSHHVCPRIEGLAPQSTSKILEYARCQWRDILGVEVRWSEVSWPAFIKQIQESPPAVFLMSWTADYPDADNFLRTANWVGETRWWDARFTALVSEARGISDPEKRLSIHREAEHVLAQEMPTVPLIYGRNHYLIKPWVRAGPLNSPFSVPNLEYVVIDRH